MLIITGLLVIFGGIFWFSKSEKQADNNRSGESAVTTSSHIQGAGNKGVTLIEYGDLECPACGQYYPILKEVKKKFGDDLKFQFRHFPLQIHPQARAAHRAAEAAGRQGKFFEMHDMLYERQQSWAGNSASAQMFESYAEELNLDMAKYRADVASDSINGVINADIAEGQKAGARATPTFVLNGKTIEQNPRSLDDFIKLIEDAMSSSSDQ